jgi:hypothetical protein
MLGMTVTRTIGVSPRRGTIIPPPAPAPDAAAATGGAPAT